MDKIKQAMAWAKRNRFWLGAFFLALTMIGCWVFAANSIDANTQKYVSEVKSKISAAENIMKVTAEDGVLVHPNKNTEVGMRELLGQSADEIVKAWKLRYEAQGKILQWPKEILADKEFCDRFDRYKPSETFPIEGEFKNEPLLIFYLSKIPLQMQRICAETLRAKWNYDPKYSKATYNATPDEELSRFAVVWDDANQELWRNKMSRFRGYDDHAGSIDGPTPLQMFMLQQDLWLLEAMFEVIREINGDVSANDLAKIKSIDHVVFGREAARTKLGALTPPNAGMVNVEETETIVDRSASELETEGAVVTGFDPTSSRKPFHGRYVNEDFLPISADEVLKVLSAVTSGKALPDSSLELIVAKRVPVRIALKMDEREIPNFMIACANSPFAFEIHQVRKNRHTPGLGIVLNGGNMAAASPSMDRSSREGGGGKGRPAPSSKSGAGMGMEMGGMEGVGGGTSATASTKGVETRTNFDVDVEFFGIVKIYNPVAENYFRTLIGSEAAGAPQASLNRQNDSLDSLDLRSRPWQLTFMNRWMPNALTN